MFSEYLESLNLTKEPIETLLLGGAIGAAVTSMIILAIILVIALYVYMALAWSTIAKKLKHKKPWLAWIPFANVSLILQLGEFHWAWVFLFLIPIVGWIAIFVLIIISTWRIFEKRKYPGWFSLSQVIPEVGGILYLVAIGFVAWKDQVKSKKK
jgi:hypothetical protein